MECKIVILCEVTHTNTHTHTHTHTHTEHVIYYKWILSKKNLGNSHYTPLILYETQEERISHQSVDATVLLRRGNEIIFGSRGKEQSRRDPVETTSSG